MLMHDLIIIGGGPAGAAAGVYAARKKMKTLLITESFGGQSIVSDGIENWIGETNISGLELAKKLEEHVRAQEGIEIKMPAKAKKVEASGDGFKVASDKGEHQAKAVLIATGGRRRKLAVPGEDKFEGKGVNYCTTCDAPLFKGKTVAVVGGGNAALEGVIDLSSYAKKIYVLDFAPELLADPVTQEEVKVKGDLVTLIQNVEIQEILGENKVSGLKYKNRKSKKVEELKVEGVFIEIGSAPNSEAVKGLVKLNKAGEIIVDHKTQAASKKGVFAAGDVTDAIYKQNNTAVGDAVKAALSVYDYCLKLKK